MKISVDFNVADPVEHPNALELAIEATVNKDDIEPVLLGGAVFLGYINYINDLVTSGQKPNPEAMAHINAARMVIASQFIEAGGDVDEIQDLMPHGFTGGGMMDNLRSLVDRMKNKGTFDNDIPEDSDDNDDVDEL